MIGLARRAERRPVRPVQQRAAGAHRPGRRDGDGSSAPGDARQQLDRWSGDVLGRGACHLPDGAVRFLRSGLRRVRPTSSPPTRGWPLPRLPAAAHACACREPAGQGGRMSAHLRDRPDRVRRARGLRRALPRVDRARRLGLPDRRRRPDPRPAARSRAPRRVDACPKLALTLGTRTQREPRKPQLEARRHAVERPAGCRCPPGRAHARGAARCRCRRPARRRARRCGPGRSAGCPAPASATVMLASRPSATTLDAHRDRCRAGARCRAARRGPGPTVPRDARTSTFLSATTSSARRERANAGRQRSAWSCATLPRLTVAVAARARLTRVGEQVGDRRLEPIDLAQRGLELPCAGLAVVDRRPPPRSAGAAPSAASAAGGTRSPRTRARAPRAGRSAPALLSSPWAIASISGTPKRPARTEKSPSPSCAERRAIASSGRASRRACRAASATAVSTPPRLSAAISSHSR